MDANDQPTHGNLPQHIIVSEIRDAVAAGIREAVSDPDLWAAAGKAIRVHAQAEAGSWLFGGLRAAASRVTWIVIIATGIYMLGGWAAVVTFFKAASPP